MTTESIVGYSYGLITLAFAYLVNWVWDKKLPKDAPMGLTMSIFLPALGHIYIYKLRSLAYVTGLVLLGFLLSLFMDLAYASVIVSITSTALMYWRLVIRNEYECKGPARYRVILDLDSETQKRLNAMAEAMGISRAEVVRRALAGFAPGD